VRDCSRLGVDDAGRADADAFEVRDFHRRRDGRVADRLGHMLRDHRGPVGSRRRTARLAEHLAGLVDDHGENLRTAEIDATTSAHHRASAPAAA
jgi:hypothetical protein